MPSIYHLNPPPNPFWEFVAGLEDHPFWGRRSNQPPAYASRDNANAQNESGADPEAQPEPEPTTSGPSEKAKGKQATVEDPPEVDPASLNTEKEKDSNKEKCGRRNRDMPFRGRGRFAAAVGDDAEEPRRGPGCGRGRGGFEGRGGHHGPHHHHHGGPPPFMFGPHGPFWARRGPPPPEGEAHHGPGPHHHHPPPPPGFEGRHRGPPPFAQRGWGPRAHGCGRRGGSPPEGFKLPEFLNNLGERFGVDFSGAAAELGRFTAPRNANSEADFEPKTDIFDTPTQYIIHLSLPGAKKSDLGVDWDGEHSILRIAGVVHRPNADEELLSHLVLDGRKRETGVFEKNIRLGTKRDPANIDIAGISAKMTDGVLVVKIPKIEFEHHTREVNIASNTPSPARAAAVDETHEKNLMEADDEMYDAPAAAPATTTSTTAAAEKAREAEAEHEHEHDDRSDTMDFEHPAEHLPIYTPSATHTHTHDEAEADEEDDWEKAGSDVEGERDGEGEGEGEYVKINVD